MKNIIIHLLILVVLMSGCDSFVDVDLPDSQLTGEMVFEDSNTATAALVHVYSRLRDAGFLSGSVIGSPTLLGLYVDELTYFGESATSEEALFNNTLLPSTFLVGQLWNDSYNQVYCANAVIEGVQNSTAINETDKNQLIGEALFIRALVHFYLVNVYGDIPYIETTDYQQNRLAMRLPVNSVYEKIVIDLENAISLLPQQYITADRVRPNKATAQALLSRTFLFTGRWSEAENAASAVISNPLYIWEKNLNKVFLKESTSTIWQLNPLTEGDNSREGSAFIFFDGPPITSAISPTLLNSFESGDQRQEYWTKAVTNGTDTWYHAYKYKANGNTGTSIEYSVLFRLAEQYLIRAEARVMQGNINGAVEDLNKIRHRAGLPDTNAATLDQLITAILDERRHELFTEYGHRFFDLKRTGQIDAFLSAVKPAWNTTDRVWPLPESELLANPNLTPQNPGY